MTQPQWLYVAAIIFFILAVIPHGYAIRFEWVAAACCVAAQLN